MEGIVYSPKNRIPLFRIITVEDGSKVVELYNVRTGGTEVISILDLAVYLVKKESNGKNENKMIYSPEKKIPLGCLVKGEDGSFYIQIKFKRKLEEIQFATYIALLLDAHQEVKAS